MTPVQVKITYTSYVSNLFCYFLLLFSTFFTLFTCDQFFRLIITKKSGSKWSSSYFKYSSSQSQVESRHHKLSWNGCKWNQVLFLIKSTVLIYYTIFTTSYCNLLRWLQGPFYAPKPHFLFFGLLPLLCHLHYPIIALTTLCLPLSGLFIKPRTAVVRFHYLYLTLGSVS